MLVNHCKFKLNCSYFPSCETCVFYDWEIIEDGKKVKMYNYEDLLSKVNDPEELTRMLTENIRQEGAKKNGKVKELSVIKKLIKMSVKSSNYNKMFNGYHKVNYLGDTYYCFMSDKMLFASFENFGYEELSNGFDKTLESMLNNIRKDEWLEIDYEVVYEYLAICKAEKTKKPFILDFEKTTKAIDPEYLLMAMDFTKSGNVYWCKPFFVLENEIDHKICIIMPIKLVEV